MAVQLTVVAPLLNAIVTAVCRKSIERVLLVATGCLLLASCSNKEFGQEETVDNSDWPMREQRVRDNMQEVQVAAEHYAANHGSCNYPLTTDSLKPYLPGGNEARPAAVGPANPFNGANEFPKQGHITDVRAIRHGKPFALGRGVIEYSVLKDGAGYAVVGGGHDGMSLMDPDVPDQVLVLSNE